MRSKIVLILILVVSFIGLQVTVFDIIFSSESAVLRLESEKHKEILQEQLSSLKNSTAHLNSLQLTLNTKFQQITTGTQKVSDNFASKAQIIQESGKRAQNNIRGYRVGIKDLSNGEKEQLLDATAQLEHLRGLIGARIQVAEVQAEPVNGKEGTVFPSGNEDGVCVGPAQDAAKQATAAVVTVTFDREDYLKRHLDSLLAVHGRDPSNREKFPLFVSQDGVLPKEAVASLVKSYIREGVSYLHHQEDEPPKKLLNAKENLAYYRIANHYKFILRTFFDCFGFSKIIILEDDMELSPDFFSYFTAMGRLLDRDASLFCVSSWNDHGQERFVRDETAMYRSDFFPGLGWMLGSDFWGEVKQDWPKAYWDDWMRLNKTRQGRQCLRPEICRTYNFGAKGSSRGFYFKRFLAPIRLNSAEVDWSKQDLSYLEPARYEQLLNASLASAQPASTADEAKSLTGDVVIRYDTQEHYELITGRLGMLKEWKDGVPRGGYKGVVTVRWEKARLFLAPSQNFTAPETGNLQRTDSTGALIRRPAPKSLNAN